MGDLRHEAGAILAQWHAVSPTQISEAEWWRRYETGEQPWEAADWLASAVLTGRCGHERYQPAERTSAIRRLRDGILRPRPWHAIRSR
jgi:hypothetical protein